MKTISTTQTNYCNRYFLNTISIHALLFLLLTLSIACSSGGSSTNVESKESSTPSINGTTENRIELLKLSLDESLVTGKSLPGYNQLNDKSHIDLINIYQDVEISLNEVPVFDNVTIYLKTDSQIKEQANALNGYIYVTVSQFDIYQTTSVIGLRTDYKRSDDQINQGVTSYGGGFYSLYYEKINNLWTYSHTGAAGSGKAK